MTHKIVIDEQGVIRCLHNPAVPMHELGVVTRTRISHIVPLWFPKRAVFRLLRIMFGERGRVADWTRSWRGPWHASIVATGAWSVFEKRADCVAWEIQQINDNPAKFDL